MGDLACVWQSTMASNDSASTNNNVPSRGSTSARRRRAAARTTNTISTTASAGAAAEPEPEPEPPPSAAAPAPAAPTYNVRDDQNPDAGAAQDLTKPSKAKKGKKGGASQHVCFRCGKASAKCRSCGQCHLAGLWPFISTSARMSWAQQIYRFCLPKSLPGPRSVAGLPVGSNLECLCCAKGC